MPIFEYRCLPCGERYELLRSGADEPAPRCPRCGESRSERVPSAFAVVAPRAAPARGPCGSDDCACRDS